MDLLVGGFIVGAIGGICLFILRWIASAFIPERQLVKFDVAVDKAAKIGCLVFIIAFAAFIVFLYKL